MALRERLVRETGASVAGLFGGGADEQAQAGRQTFQEMKARLTAPSSTAWI